MSDSDDDWFKKDIDEIVQEVEKKKILQDSSIDEPDLQTEKGVPKFMFDDYGGNYDIPLHKMNKNQKTHKPIKGEDGFVPSLSFKKLSFISEMTPLNVFLEVTQPDCGFIEILNEEKLSEDHVFLIVRVLKKLFDLPIDEFKKGFLTIFVGSTNFFKNLETVLLPTYNETTVQIKKNVFFPNSKEIAQELLDICKCASKFKMTNDLIKTLSINMEKHLLSAGSKFKDIQNDWKTYNNTLLSKSDAKYIEEIYPTFKELNGDESHVDDLKPNIIKGKYESVQNYLQIHLHLLREDFLLPLKDLVIELKQYRDLDEIVTNKIYKKTRILLNEAVTTKTRKGELLFVDLKSDQRNDFRNAPPTTDNNWINPKKLMYGSLLLFTTSLEFNNLIFAMVSNRDFDMIQSGYVQIEILKMYNIGEIFDKDFIMLESDVFFEPYHYVHRALRSLDESTFPMKNYIVGVEKVTHPPDYLRFVENQSYVYKNIRFNPLDHKSYPSDQCLGLDKSQSHAFHHALSKKFSLIQGPPGTGKTYIGLKVIETLLENVDAQILVICYTNHALDQFLMGVLKTTDNIVRMGNQSKHELLDKYNIKQINDNATSDRRLKTCFFNIKNEYLQKFKEFEDIQQHFDNSEESYAKITKVQLELRSISRKLEELKQINEYNFLKSIKVIGMTTSCAARCNLLLHLLKTPIVLIEEAAEVLEAHVVASLTKDTQHVILIGDHFQLRPTTSVYMLARKYKMDISLFERMVENKLNCVCLELQHRMRPEMADLIRPSIYKTLKDHESVLRYPNVRGVAKNLFFVSHNFQESKFNDETTKRNVHEAQFMCAFANYLLLQQYKPEDIVLLTTYNGQMIQLLNERKQYPNLQRVRVTVVDNFQGEESRIILLSLVRNNDYNRIGYLALQNRICVTLSRAQEGLFIIGSMEFMASNNTIWKGVKEKLEELEAIGESLPLLCERHGTIMMVKNILDFDLVKYGGCQQRCDSELICGHRCSCMCHSDDFEHRDDCSNYL